MISRYKILAFFGIDQIKGNKFANKYKHVLNRLISLSLFFKNISISLTKPYVLHSNVIFQHFLIYFNL